MAFVGPIDAVYSPPTREITFTEVSGAVRYKVTYSGWATGGTLYYAAPGQTPSGSDLQASIRTNSDGKDVVVLQLPNNLTGVELFSCTVFPIDANENEGGASNEIFTQYIASGDYIPTGVSLAASTNGITATWTPPARVYDSNADSGLAALRVYLINLTVYGSVAGTSAGSSSGALIDIGPADYNTTSSKEFTNLIAGNTYALCIEISVTGTYGGSIGTYDARMYVHPTTVVAPTVSLSLIHI